MSVLSQFRRAERHLAEREEARRAADDLAEALRLTVEYVGTDTLPPVPGWSWYDALVKHRPDIAAQLAADDARVREPAASLPLRHSMWMHRDPPPGTRWMTPQECHGNPSFCSTCSPRYRFRPTVRTPDATP